MNNQSIEKLRVDRRLHSRRDWIAAKELQDELDALPDVSDKIKRDDEEPQADSLAAAEGGASVSGGPSAALPEDGGV
jgi:hypothetical protein